MLGKPTLPPPSANMPTSPSTFGGQQKPQASAFRKFSFAPALAGFTPRNGGRRSYLGE